MLLWTSALRYTERTWSWWTDLNPRPADYKSAALPTELHQRAYMLRSGPDTSSRKHIIKPASACQVFLMMECCANKTKQKKHHRDTGISSFDQYLGLHRSRCCDMLKHHFSLRVLLLARRAVHHIIAKGNCNMKRTITILLAILLLLGAFTPAALAGDFPFTDVEPWRWFSTIRFVYEKGIMRGTSETTFSPDQDFSRAMLAATLFRLYHERDANDSDPTSHPFTDVPAWASPYVAWAFEVGLTRGVAATRFAPSTVTTRQDFSVMLHRFAALIEANTSSPPNQTGIFEDAHLLEPWAEDAMDWAVHHGVIHRIVEDDRPFGRFYLRDTVTRLQAVSLLRLFVRRITHPPESASLSCPEMEARIKHDWAEFLNDYRDWRLRTRDEYPRPPRPHYFPIWFHSHPFHRHHADHIRIDGYFGTYNGSVVLMMRSRYQLFNTDAPRWGVEVIGYVFGFIDGLPVLVWSEGAFYNPQNAHELGLLTAEDIGRAHSKFVEWRQVLGEFIADF